MVQDDRDGDLRSVNVIIVKVPPQVVYPVHKFCRYAVRKYGRYAGRIGGNGIKVKSSVAQQHLVAAVTGECTGLLCDICPACHCRRRCGIVSGTVIGKYKDSRIRTYRRHRFGHVQTLDRSMEGDQISSQSGPVVLCAVPGIIRLLIDFAAPWKCNHHGRHNGNDQRQSYSFHNI